MAKVFKGRPVVAGECTAPALVSHGGFNTLASFQMAMMFGDKSVKCGDQNNSDLYKKPMKGTALCLPQTIGSTTGGMVLYTACATNNLHALLQDHRLAGRLRRNPRGGLDGCEHARRGRARRRVSGLRQGRHEHNRCGRRHCNGRIKTKTRGQRPRVLLCEMSYAVVACLRGAALLP